MTTLPINCWCLFVSNTHKKNCLWIFIQTYACWWSMQYRFYYITISLLPFTGNYLTNLPIMLSPVLIVRTPYTTLFLFVVKTQAHAQATIVFFFRRRMGRKRQRYLSAVSVTIFLRSGADAWWVSYNHTWNS